MRADVILPIVLAYLIGSVPFAVILSRRRGTDLRRIGSGNPGATNVLRASGWGLGLTVMAVDLAKVGVKPQLQTTEWAVYLDKRKNGQMPLYMLGWTGDNGDPDNFLCYFFCAPGVSRAMAT